MLFGTGEKKTPKIVGVKLRKDSSSDEILPLKKVTEANPNPYDPDDSKYRKRPQKFPTFYGFLIFLYVISLFFLVLYCDSVLPKALTKQDSVNNPDSFIEERARNYLKQLTSVGPRPAGSYENEVLAVDYLKREINSIKSRAKPAHKITMDIQKPRGSYNLDFIDGLTQHYRNIQNVIVKLDPAAKSAKDSLLINCHFDSVPLSPGASDDAVSCAIMLEVLEVITQNELPLKHSLIFLFNGAEENLLPGSHGFITQHEWASTVRAFINLEACGAGGREVVFQSGPNHPWMIQAYGEVAPHPFASVVGQEIFQSGVIPGETDFRIFRDYGKIPGLDIAYVKNGYVYHTKYDTEDRIPEGSIQRAGDNVLAVVRHIANSEILAHTELSSKGNVVFFDFLGLCLICYPEWIGVIINIGTVILSAYCTYTNIHNSHKIGVSSSTYVKQLGHSLFYQIVGVCFSLLVVILIATFLDAMGRTMSWYSRPYLIFFLYVCPTLFVVTAVFQFALPRQKKDFHYSGANWSIESLYFEVNRMTWTFFLLLFTLLRLQSAYFCLCFVLWPTLARIFLKYFFEKEPHEKVDKDWKWLSTYMLFLFFPIIFGMYMMLNTFVMFVPIMGRAGSAINPDLLIGCQTTLMTLGTICYITPLIALIYKPNRIITFLYLTTLVSVIVVVVTRIGFPYSGDKNSLALHRSLIFHTERQFFHKDGVLKREDSGYVVVNLDRNSPHILKDFVAEYHSLHEIGPKQCEDMIYCGVPMYYPCSTMLTVNNWIPGPKPRIHRKTNIELLTSEKVGIQRLKLLFRATGPDHMGIYFSPSKNVQLINWSFVEDEIMDGPIWKDNRKTYFIFYSHGLNPGSWEFWLEFKVPKTFIEFNDDLLDLSIAGHFVHGNEMKSPDFKRFLSQFPDWSEPVGWSASYKSFVF